jgi:HD-GYP domain-containing protein (c-di-GMP phosphodiesterase class II)
MSQTIPTSSAAETKPIAMPIPTAALDNLASRVRPSGLFLMMLLPDGRVIYHDQAAGLFFHRFVLPLVQYAEQDGSASLAQRVGQIDATSNIRVCDAIPGAALAAFPYVERRQLAGVFLMAAKSTDFKLGEDVLRQCGRLGLDGAWLAQQAEPLAAYNQEDIERHARLLLTMVRDQVRLSGLQSELDSLSNQLSNNYEELSLIYQISSGMRINRRAGDFFKQACLDLLEVMGVRGMGVALCGEHAARQQPVLYGEMILPPGAVHRLAEELTPVLASRTTPLLINDLRKEPRFAWLTGHVHGVLAVPMQRQDQVLGFYFALDKRAGDFDSQDSKLLNSISNESAIYLENAMLYDDVHGLMMGLLHSLTSAVDAKDAYTHGHSERVAALGRQLTIEAALGDPLAERVYLAGLLHDVGKIGVPESVLHKTGRLTPEEFAQMKKHPQIGARILADVKQVRDILPGVLHHHERYDGNGYPHGLAGEKIPLMGRLICLADCFDAMTSNRTYRKALPLEVALTEIRRCGGTQFDPGLTEAFLRIGAEKLRELVLPPQKLAGVAGAGLLLATSPAAA